jgi:hypothetical protein
MTQSAVRGFNHLVALPLISRFKGALIQVQNIAMLEPCPVNRLVWAFSVLHGAVCTNCSKSRRCKEGKADSDKQKTELR